MKYHVQPLWIVVPLVIGAIAGFFADSLGVALAVAAFLLLPAFLMVYVPYAKDNPNQVWFKRKLYGWGWTPVTWQGWLIVGVYAALIIAFSFTIDENSPPQEVAFTFLLPVVLLTIAMIRISYRKGERPRWQWGDNKNNDT